MIATVIMLLTVQAGQPTMSQPAAKPKLICREDEQMVGSHIHTGRRCKTADEWLQEDARTGQAPTTLRVMPTDGSAQQQPQRPPI